MAKETEHHGAGGMSTADNAVIIAGIRSCLPSIMTEIFDTNMAAMEDRLTASINNMTKRLEDKIDSANVSNNERFENLEVVQEGFSNRIQDLEDRLVSVESACEKSESAYELSSNLHDILISLAKRVVFLEEERIREKENRYQESQIEDLNRRMFDLTSEVRDKRICISGIKEAKNESPRKAVVRTLKQLSTKHNNPTPSQAKHSQPIITDDDIDIAYRTGKKIGSKPQDIVVHLKWAHTKMKIMALKKRLMADKESKFFISDDIPFELRGLRQKLRNINDAAKKLEMDSKIVGNKILLNGKMFTCADLDGLADDLLEGAAQIKEVEGGLAYRGEAAFLSNFHNAPFELDEHRFANVEQYYQYKKCLRLGHINMAMKILRMSKPLQAKALGDKYDDTDSAEWMEDRAQCMLNGTVAKFTQNPALAKKLMNTGESGLYEATTDKYFGAGIGLGSKLWTTGNWTGVNAAGKICMNVRKLLNHETEKGVDLSELGGLIEYPVSWSSIPNAIEIQPEVQFDATSSEIGSNESKSESEAENTSSSDDESVMDEGTEQEEVSSQVETEPVANNSVKNKEKKENMEVDQKNKQENDKNSSGKGKENEKTKKKGKFGGKNKNKNKRNMSQTKDSSRKSKNYIK